ncbi:hypothetical protein [Vibrio harveyi]|uniref:hypothetical protein n=1 Tax=Vibrio harveyi TaxID=669 RepID=UPI0018F23B05|nr:hypothetical protein [Vibrio harveyi]
MKFLSQQYERMKDEFNMQMTQLVMKEIHRVGRNLAKRLPKRHIEFVTGNGTWFFLIDGEIVQNVGGVRFKTQWGFTIGQDDTDLFDGIVALCEFESNLDRNELLADYADRNLEWNAPVKKPSPLQLI